MRTTLFKCLLFAALLLFASGQLAAQDGLDKNIDSIQRAIKNARVDTSRVNLYITLMPMLYSRYALKGTAVADSLAFFQLTQTCRRESKTLDYSYGWGMSLLWDAYFYYFRGNTEICEENLDQAFNVLRTASNDRGLAAAYFFKAELRPGVGDMKDKLNLYDSCIQYARKCGHCKWEYQALKGKGAIHIAEGDYEQGTKELQETLELQRICGTTKMHITTDILAYAYAKRHMQKEALQYALASLEHARRANDTVMIVTLYQRLGTIYGDIYNYEKSYYYEQKALAAFTPGSSDISRIVELSILSAMSNALIHMNRAPEAITLMSDWYKKYKPAGTQLPAIVGVTYLEFYMGIGDYARALVFLQDILRNKKKWTYRLDNQLQILTMAAQLSLHFKQYETAAIFADSAYNIAIRLKSWTHIMTNTYTFYRLDSIRGDLASAMKQYKLYKRASDSLQKDIADKHFIELTVQYETDQKNSELASLANRSKLQQETIRQSNKLRNLMFVVACLLLALLLAAFNRYRVKQKLNRKMQEKQREINRQNQVLEKMVADEKKITTEKDKLLTEKEWLIREINHRVKNNLQVVMSLLDTQRVYLKDEVALNAINDSQHRVQAISLIHKKLYQSDHLRTVIDMGSYVKEVTEYLSDSLGLDDRISINLLIEDVQLDVTQAVPIGLIINEAFTNAVKYAFRERDAGELTILMKKTTGNITELHITDDGSGFPEHFDWQRSQTLGISLMRGLARQIDGHFELTNNNGLTVKISFEPAQLFRS